MTEIELLRQRIDGLEAENGFLLNELDKRDERIQELQAQIEELEAELAGVGMVHISYIPY